MGNYTENRQNGTNGEDPVFLSLAVIEERIQEKLTVKNLADCVHFSKYHYQRLFREAVGDSVMGYVARRRISLAAAELAETDDSVLEIALKYGYDSHEGFTRSFKSYMGITPTEYRKYHLSTGAFKMQKEKHAMIYSKTTDEIIRELNGLIVQARETAAFTRKSLETDSEAVVFYFRFWNFIADRTEAMAEELTRNLDRIAAIAQQPDEISARFLMIKAMEDAAFRLGIVSFQAGLTTARAKPEHREAFLDLCDKYTSLSRSARIRAGRVAEFLKELAALIFQDMRKHAEQKIRQAVEKGMEAVCVLSKPPMLPYQYIADEVRRITEELSALPLEKVTVSCLEDYLCQLDMIAFTADVDALRAPDHRPLFGGILIFREQISEAAEFFQSLPADAVCMSAEREQNTETGEKSSAVHTLDENVGEMVSWGNILCFTLRGEIQKLGDNRLNEEQKNAFDAICQKLSMAIRLAGRREDGAADLAAGCRVDEILRQVYREMTVQAERLGVYGAVIQYIAEEVKRFLSPL